MKNVYTYSYHTGSLRALASKIRLSAAIPAVLSLMLLMSVSTGSQASSPKATPVLESNAQVSTSQPHANKVSLDFVGSDIHDVVKALAMQSGVNIIAGSDVKGEVTVSLSNISVEDALKLVTGMSGYKFAQVNGTYIIGTEANIDAVSAQGIAISKNDVRSAAVVQIKYADVNSITTLLNKEYPTVKIVKDRDSKSESGASSGSGDGGSKSQSPHGSTILVLQGPAEDVKVAKSIAQEIESSLGDSVREMTIDTYEVRFGNVHDMRQAVMNYIPGVRVMEAPGAYDFNKIASKTNSSLSAAFSASTGISGFGVTNTSNSSSTSTTSSTTQSGSSQDPDEKDDSKGTPAMMNLLVMQGSKEDIARAKDLLAKLDIPENQIVLEAKILDMSTDVSKDLGIDWSWGSFTIGETDTLNDTTTLGKFHRTPAEISATISALITQGKGKVLANPNVCILDGKQANIFIGDEVTYLASSGTTIQGAQLLETATVNVGVGLLALCRISSDGYITMSLRPEVSTITSWMDVPGGGSLPQIATRKVTSTVRVKNGETIVIGGLLRDDEFDNVSKVPIMSDLPLLGGLFKNKHKVKTHSEVMMFITPRILTSD